MDYIKLEEFCNIHRLAGDRAIDWIMYYGAEKNKLAKQFDLKEKVLKHVFGKLDPVTLGKIKTQYITFEIFKEDGLIHKYLNHAAVKNLAKKDYEILKEASLFPYKYAFVDVLENPAPDFYKVQNVFTDEEMLVYSPGMTHDVKRARMFFLLVYNNGQCYQTFGPMGGFMGFDADDVHCYTTEWEPDLESDQELSAYIQKNPLKFSALLAYSNLPFTAHKEHVVVETITFAEAGELDQQKFKKNFNIENIGGLYRFIHKRYGEFPHFATLYHGMPEEELVLVAMTEKGHQELVKSVLEIGVELPVMISLRVHPTMRLAMKEIFRREISFHPYEGIFDDADPTAKDKLAPINEFLSLMMDQVNANKKPDLKKLSEKSGIDMQTANDLYKMILEKVGKDLG